MKTLEFIPIVLFFLVYKLPEKMISLVSPLLSEANIQFLLDADPFMLATAVFLPASVLMVSINYLKTKKVDKMNLIILLIVLALGVPSIILNNKTLFMWKPTVANWLFAAAFLMSAWIGSRKTIIQRMLDEQISLPDVIWNRLNLAWVGFFIVSGVLNLIVAFNFSENTWVNFKLFGLMGLTLVFALGQGVYLSRHMQPEPTTTESSSDQEK